LLCLLAESARGRGLQLRGIERSPAQVTLARLALAGDGVVEQGDLRAAALPPSDRIALIDVIHYLEPRAQDELLARVGAALRPGGVLLMRVCDDGQRARATLTRALDRFGALLRGELVGRLHGRSAADWCAALERLGLRIRVEPASQGTPFANVLITARRAR
jgi:SAM-dependent methyltransferase